MIPDRITFRLGTLRAVLTEACEKSGNTPSEEIRLRLSRSLKVPVPRMRRGQPRRERDERDE